MNNVVRTCAAVVAGMVVGMAAVPAYAVDITPTLAGLAGQPLLFKYTGFTAPTADDSDFAGDEQTFGWGTLEAVTNLAGTTNHWAGGIGNDERVSFFLYGIADRNIITLGPNDLNIYNEGCSGGDCDGLIHVDFYLESIAGDTNDSNTTLDPAERTGFADMPGITDEGPLLMRWVLDPGIVDANIADPGDGSHTDGAYDETNAELFQNTTSSTLPATGDGEFFASCVSGPACQFIDSNIFNDGLSDIFGQFTLVDATDDVLFPGSLWPGRIADPAQVQAVPEPGTLTLFGLGTLALGAVGMLRRRKGNR